MTSPKRRTREETRQMVVEAALDLIRLEGLGAEPTTISYQRVFDHLEATTGARVTRASVHERIWDSQEDFQHEVLLRASEGTSGAPQTQEIATAVFQATEGLLPRARMTEMTRLAAPANLRVAESDDLFYSWIGMTMSLARDPQLDLGRRDDLANAASSIYSDFKTETIGLLRGLGDTLGLRPRDDLFPDGTDGFELIVDLGIALSEGVSVRTRLDRSELADVQLKTGPNGEEQSWTAFAAAYWALLSTYLEVDPAAHPDLVDDESA